MLRNLELKDFAIIDELQLELSGGLNVLTGETGAGKSILVDALALLIGGRGDSSFVRSGADSALIQGLFDAAELESATRRLQRNGRSTARLDGELVNISELARAGSDLVAIHGQHASQTLLDADAQRELLDRMLSEEDKTRLRRFRTGYSRYKSLETEVTGLKRTMRERAQRLDVLNYQLEEIAGANLQKDEETALNASLESLRHAEQILQGTSRAADMLVEAEPNAVQLLADALRSLEAAARYQADLGTLSKELRDALQAVQAIGQELESFLGSFEADPRALEQVELRLLKLEGLKTKYGDTLEAVLAYYRQAEEELASLQGADEDMESRELELTTLSEELASEAAKLSAARRQLSATLAQAVCGHLAVLGMPGTRFEVAVTALDAFGPTGCDKVSFSFSANPGEPLAPLSAVASGGELSRVMLALNLVTGSEVETLVFDEVDAGIGGETGRKVGALLKRLAQNHQVLVVTHLAQVAAFADSQYLVEKCEQEGRTVTRVSRLTPQQREAELARMLSGSVSETALAHARELMAEARTPGPKP